VPQANPMGRTPGTLLRVRFPYVQNNREFRIWMLIPDPDFPSNPSHGGIRLCHNLGPKTQYSLRAGGGFLSNDPLYHAIRPF
jgi:hypothetical protein